MQRLHFLLLFQLEAIVLNLLEDIQPEVRVKASRVLSGMLHCRFIPDPDNLLVSEFD